MTNENIVRAWKDVNYRNSLSEADRAALPDHPAGRMELGNGEWNQTEGGRAPVTYILVACTWLIAC
jgi:mersacidin/lichenicidin family type 2 lantibiotic